MSVFDPQTDARPLSAALRRPDTWLVACFCAAWCDTCTQYRERFDALALSRPEHTFAWIDIEAMPELLGDVEVENFPTLLVQSEQDVLFYGTMLPHIGHLERLLESLREGAALSHPAPELPDVRAALSL